MIIVKITGGLGNQLFQYAAGKRLASVHNTELRLDTMGFETYKLHDYSLNHFKISAIEASKAEIEKIGLSSQKGLLTKLRKRLGYGPSKQGGIKHIKDDESSFNPSILNLPDDVYLDGYWQSEKYFKDKEGLIREEYVLKAPLSKESEDISKEILGSDAVAIHIRRTDYVTNQKNQSVYENLDLDYYHRALGELAKKASQPRLFIFSDDIEWVREHFKPGFDITYMDFNGVERNYEDLYLMSLCKHHIIANSSFSWWGAWLSQSQDKLVFAPKRWYKDRPMDIDNRYPRNWTTI